MLCSSNCDSVDEDEEQDDEETADATEIQENMMDLTQVGLHMLTYG